MTHPSERSTDRIVRHHKPSAGHEITLADLYQLQLDLGEKFERSTNKRIAFEARMDERVSALERIGQAKSNAWAGLGPTLIIAVLAGVLGHLLGASP